MIQLSILKVVGYGPWTLTLGSDREHELQMLQASLYRHVQKLFSERGCIVFFNRFDEFFAVSNGMTLEDHISIQKNLRESFNVNFLISIGYGNTPFEANLKAHEGFKNNKMLDKEHGILGYTDSEQQHTVSIMHFDVNDLTARTKTDSPYEISSIIFELHATMSKYFLGRDSLAFFMGGDNFMIVASDDARRLAGEFIKITKDKHKISMNCGIGTAGTAREAIKLATKSLDTIREMRDSGKEKLEVYELSC